MHIEPKDLFKEKIAIKALNEIRDATNKAWSLSGDKFKYKIETLTKHQAAPGGFQAKGRSK